MSRRGNFLELPSYQAGLRAQMRGPVEPEDTSHLDHQLLSDRCDLILAETAKAYKLRLGSWRIKQRDVWAPKSQVQLVTEDGIQWALFPIWLAKKWGYTITLETKPRKPQTAPCQQCGAAITTYTTTPGRVCRV